MKKLIATLLLLNCICQLNAQDFDPASISTHNLDHFLELLNISLNESDCPDTWNCLSKLCTSEILQNTEQKEGLLTALTVRKENLNLKSGSISAILPVTILEDKELKEVEFVLKFVQELEGYKWAIDDISKYKAPISDCNVDTLYFQPNSHNLNFGNFNRFFSMPEVYENYTTTKNHTKSFDHFKEAFLKNEIKYIKQASPYFSIELENNMIITVEKTKHNGKSGWFITNFNQNKI